MESFMESFDHVEKMMNDGVLASRDQNKVFNLIKGHKWCL